MTIDRVLTSSTHDLRLAIPALTAFLACLVSVAFSPGILVAGLVLVVGLVCVWWGHTRKQVVLEGLSVSIIIAGIMILCVALGEVPRHQPHILAAEGEETTLRVQLDATSLPGESSHVGRIMAIENVALERGPVSTRLAGALGPERYSAGTVMEVKGFILRAETHDSEAWIVLLRGPGTIVQPPHPFFVATDALRAGFLELSTERPGDAGGLLPGLAIGDTSMLEPGLEHAMQVTSLSHLVAVSGANCAIVVGLVVGLVRLLRGGPWLRVAAGLLALVGFVALVTPEPSIMRASLMASIVLVSLALNRPVRGIPALSATVMALLAMDPWLSTSFAFVLSVAATTGILCVTGPLSRMLGKALPQPLAVGLALPIAAQLACMPILILLSPAIATWGVLANAVAAPVAPIATIVGMVACVVTPLFPWLAGVLISLAMLPASFIAGVGRTLSEWPGASLPWPAGWLGAAILALACYSALAWLMLSAPRSQLANRMVAGCIVLAGAVVIAGFGVPTLLTKVSVPDHWSLAQCDVEQGDALVVRSEGRHLLIDTGSSEDHLEQCFDLLGITDLDIALITHFDKDHVGAWKALIPFSPEVWIGVAEDERKEDFVQDFARAGLSVREVEAGDSFLFGHYLLEIVWPTRAALAEEGNDSSVVLHLLGLESCTECLSAVFLGDLGEKAQRILSARLSATEIEAVKVSHHGSPDQYEALYEKLGARISLIGVGAKNGYGHPAQDLVRALGKNSLVLRTDLSGTSALHKSDSGDIVVWSERTHSER